MIKTKAKIQINDIVFEGLLETGMDVTIILPTSWHQDWHLQKVNIQLLGIETLSHVKQNTK